MAAFSVTELALQPAASSAGRARREVRSAAVAAGATDLVDSAQLVISELVTNAVVHAGTPMDLRITADASSIRVEIEDANPHLPTRRTWTTTAGTGRGLLIVDAHADRWGAAPTERGKVVWFEIGSPAVPFPVASIAPEPADDTVDVSLRDVPVLMHWAWQEHAAALLREYLLYTLESDPNALGEHAAASDALSSLDEQLPKPALPTDSGALLASSVEPGVTAEHVRLRLAKTSVAHFAVLDSLLSRAVRAAQDGRLLGPPTQPEMAEMRGWLCGEVARQAAGAAPTPWVPPTHLHVPRRVDHRRTGLPGDLAASSVPLIATDAASIIVAVSPGLVQFLGYPDDSRLLGRRILVVIPPRFHQAHIAGTTLNATNGRDVLLDQWLDVPVIRADGSEVDVRLHVERRRMSGEEQIFVATFQLPRL